MKLCQSQRGRKQVNAELLQRIAVICYFTIILAFLRLPWLVFALYNRYCDGVQKLDFFGADYIDIYYLPHTFIFSDAPFPSGSAEASTSSCDATNRAKNLKQPTASQRALPAKTQRDGGLGLYHSIVI